MASKELGGKLRELRDSKGFTQQQVADELGLKNKSTLGSWEIGKSEPDAFTFLKLCKLYGVDTPKKWHKLPQETPPNFPRGKCYKT